MFILFFSSTIQLLVFLQPPGRLRPCHHKALEVSVWQESYFWGPHRSLKPEGGVGGHLLVTGFKHQVRAAAVGEMPIFSGVFPGVQYFTQVSMYCISAFFVTFVGFTGEEGGTSDF